MTLAQLPTPPSEIDLRSDADRWRPTRAGLVRIWQFDDEVLELERGRLVLYGPNGSGKTMALELLLPYLLDAQGQPGRLSTSGSDRGGLWSRVTGYEGDARTGYLWLEFRRDSGETFTIGVRLRAQPSGNGKKHWFTTTLRVGHDLGLLDRRRVPLEVDALTKAIGEHGTVWGSDTGGYREAVRTTLFPGWSEERLAALIETLLVVRKQHVTDGLSPRVLSAHLSDALPGLDERVLGKVADGFAELDRRQDEIEALERDVRITGKLAKANRDYAKLVVASVSHAVTRATTEFDNVTKTERKLRGELEDKQQQCPSVGSMRPACRRTDRGPVRRGCCRGRRSPRGRPSCTARSPSTGCRPSRRGTHWPRRRRSWPPRRGSVRSSSPPDWSWSVRRRVWRAACWCGPGWPCSRSC